jgi:transglutaminase-like putative cysteine protease
VLYTISPPEVEHGLGGDEVSQRVLRVRSQPDQIRFLRQMVNQYRQLYAIRARARDIVFRQWVNPPKDKASQAIACARWVQDNITYVEEMPEVFQTPTHTIATGYGDCDDFVTLTGSLIESIGIESELVGMHYRGEYRHIFCRAVMPNGVRIPLDATLNAPVEHLTNPIALAQDRGEHVTLCIG